MLTLLWEQRTRAELAAEGLVFDSGNASTTDTETSGSRDAKPDGGWSGDAASVLPRTIKAPAFGNLSAGQAFTIEFAVDTAALPHAVLHDMPLLDCRSCETCSGIAVFFTRSGPKSTNGTVVTISISDKHGHTQRWSTDSEARMWLPGNHHAAFVVDGFARVMSTFVNGVFGDGGHQRSQGWTHLGSVPNIAGQGDIGVVDGASQCKVNSAAVRMLRIYDRFLLTTEVISNWRHWKHHGSR